VTDKDSDKCNMAMGTDSGKEADSDRNQTTVVTENEENEVVVAQREDFTKRQEKQRDLSDDESGSEDSENECVENRKEVARMPVLNINIPCDSVSDVQNQLQNLAITQSEDGQGDLCERSPMGNERPRVRGDPPYPVSYPVI
jgi:hypothetical protein